MVAYGNFFLMREKRHPKRVIFSDGCWGQGQDGFILYICAADSLKLVAVGVKGDSMHSSIEHELKHRVVHKPDQMYTVIMNAKVHGRGCQVGEMTQAEFCSIKELIVL